MTHTLARMSPIGSCTHVVVENDLHPGSAGNSLMVTVGTGAGGVGGGEGVGVAGLGDGGDGGGMGMGSKGSSVNIIGDTVDTCCWNVGAVVEVKCWSRDVPRCGLSLNISIMASFTLDSNDCFSRLCVNTGVRRSVVCLPFCPTNVDDVKG